MSNQIKEILKEKKKAMAAFVKTKDQLERSCEKIKMFVDKNLNDITRKEEEIKDVKDVNLALQDQAISMTQSIKNIDSILNPELPKS